MISVGAGLGARSGISQAFSNCTYSSTNRAQHNHVRVRVRVCQI